MRQETQLLLTGRVYHHITLLAVEYDIRNNCSQMMTDRCNGLRTLCMLYFFRCTATVTEPDMTFKGHSRSSAMPSYVRAPRLSIRDWKRRLHLFSEKSNSEITLKLDHI